MTNGFLYKNYPLCHKNLYIRGITELNKRNDESNVDILDRGALPLR